MFISAITTQTTMCASPHVSGTPGAHVGTATTMSSSQPCAASALRVSPLQNTTGTADSYALRLTDISCAGTNPTSIKQLLLLNPWNCRSNVENEPDESYDMADDAENAPNTCEGSVHSKVVYTEAEMEELRTDREYYEALSKARSQLLDNLRSKLREIRREREKKNGFIAKRRSKTRKSNERDQGEDGRKSEAGMQVNDSGNEADNQSEHWQSSNANNSVFSTTPPRGPLLSPVPMVVKTAGAPATVRTNTSVIPAAIAAALSKETRSPRRIPPVDASLCASPLSAEEEHERQLSQAKAQAQRESKVSI